MVKKKVRKKSAPKRKAAKKAAPKRKASKRKAAPKKKASNNKALTSGLDDTFQNWVNKQVALLNKKKR